jgi:HAD superfamily hydrolase (TIGR01509 family)
MKNKKYILWDHDGVLVNTEPLYYKANKTALRELGIGLSLKNYMNYMQTGKSIWHLASDNGFTDDIILEKRNYRDKYYRQYLISENIEIKGVTDVLYALRKKYRMAIITTSKKDDFELIHKNRNILNFMDFYLVLGDYENAKPEPDPYIAGMNKFNALPDECVVIEDNARGLKSALAAGIDCIIINSGFTESHDFTGAAMIVKSIRELLEVL